MDRALTSVFLMDPGCCRGAPGSHFHDSNHTHFPTDLLRKMLHQSCTLPRSRSKSGAALSTLLRRRGRRPGRIIFPTQVNVSNKISEQILCASNFLLLRLGSGISMQCQLDKSGISKVAKVAYQYQLGKIYFHDSASLVYASLKSHLAYNVGTLFSNTVH